MARTGRKKPCPRVLVWLGVLLAAMTAVLAGGTCPGQASWTPKLALDLEGGTQMILAPKVEGGSDITEEQLNQAVAIIRQRVDGSGVAEAGNQHAVRPQRGGQPARHPVQRNPRPDPGLRRHGIPPGPPRRGRGGSQADSGHRRSNCRSRRPSRRTASDPNWITPELYQQFEALDCRHPAQPTSRNVSDPAKPMVTCEPATAGTAIKYILGPVEVPGADINGSTFGSSRAASRGGHRTSGPSTSSSTAKAPRSSRRSPSGSFGTLHGSPEPVRHRAGRTGHLRTAVQRRHHGRHAADHRQLHRSSLPRRCPTSCSSAPCRSASKSRANSRFPRRWAASSCGWACSPA